jgi:hypothetical protein
VTDMDIYESIILKFVMDKWGLIVATSLHMLSMAQSDGTRVTGYNLDDRASHQVPLRPWGSCSPISCEHKKMFAVRKLVGA